MSRVVSFSVDNKFADDLENLVESSGYGNRSRFLRDASLHFAEELQRGSIESMDKDTKIEGILVVFFQHGIEQKLHDIRHSGKIEIPPTIIQVCLVIHAWTQCKPSELLVI